jgi:hypothetical protein
MGGQIVATGEVIESISIIFDEGTGQGEGFVRLDDIFVASDLVRYARRSKGQQPPSVRFFSAISKSVQSIQPPI